MRNWGLYATHKWLQSLEKASCVYNIVLYLKSIWFSYDFSLLTPLNLL